MYLRHRVRSSGAPASLTASLFLASLAFAASANAYEGFGYQTKGGQGGTTCHVTTLASYGSGSLYNCVVNQTGPRTVVFDVSGTITPDDILYVRDPYLTIDGSTAPSPGITVKAPTSSRSAIVVESTHDVIIRGLRIVGYNPTGSVEDSADLIALDGTEGGEVYNVVIDHVSLTAADDGALDITGNVHDVTVSWSLPVRQRQGQPDQVRHAPADQPPPQRLRPQRRAQPSGEGRHANARLPQQHRLRLDALARRLRPAALERAQHRRLAGGAERQHRRQRLHREEHRRRLRHRSDRGRLARSALGGRQLRLAIAPLSLLEPLGAHHHSRRRPGRHLPVLGSGQRRTRQRLASPRTTPRNRRLLERDRRDGCPHPPDTR